MSSSYPPGHPTGVSSSEETYECACGLSFIVETRYDNSAGCVLDTTPSVCDCGRVVA